MIKIGDYVTRKSYNHDLVFKVIGINNNTYTLKGLDVRLIANAEKDDLVIAEKERCKFDDEFIKKNLIFGLNRSDYFYIPGKILHLDGDKEYLQRCMDFYKESGVMAIGKTVKEENMHKEIVKLLNDYNPDIVVITGHDAYYKKRVGTNDLYKNSSNFIKCVKEIRKYEKSNENLIVIAGACQSNYEELIKSGSNFASSPKRINIHALDPAIIAVSLSLQEREKNIDLINLLEKTKYGKDGIGGIKSKGMMYTGYPREEAS